jgi:hypothetical protein
LQELGKQGQTDTVWSNLTAVPFVPPVLLWERKVTRNVPNSYPAAGTFLLKRIGYHFPLFGKLRHGRVIKALTTVLRDNLDPSQCNLPPATKLLCAIVFATKATNPVMAADMRRCALHLGPHLLPGTCDLVAKFADEDLNFDAPSITLSDTVLREAGADLTLADRRALLLAKAGSTSPSTIGPVVLGGMEELFSPAAMIEQLVWLGICQLFHRLYLFYMDPEISPVAPSAVSDVLEPTDASFFLQPGLGAGIATDEARANSTLDTEAAAAATRGRQSNITAEDQAKGSIVRQEGPGGRLILQGAEPVYLDESFADRSSGGSGGVYGSERPHEAAGGYRQPLFKHRQYVEEDPLTQLAPVISPALPPLPPSLPRPAASSRDADGSLSLSARDAAEAPINERRGSLRLGRTLPGVSPEALDVHSSSGGADEVAMAESGSSDRRSAPLGDRAGSSSRPGSGTGSPRNFRGTVVSGGVVFPVERSRSGGGDESGF